MRARISFRSRGNASNGRADFVSSLRLCSFSPLDEETAVLLSSFSGGDQPTVVSRFIKNASSTLQPSSSSGLTFIVKPPHFPSFALPPPSLPLHPYTPRLRSFRQQQQQAAMRSTRAGILPTILGMLVAFFVGLSSNRVYHETSKAAGFRTDPSPPSWLGIDPRTGGGGIGSVGASEDGDLGFEESSFGSERMCGGGEVPKGDRETRRDQEMEKVLEQFG